MQMILLCAFRDSEREGEKAWSKQKEKRPFAVDEKTKKETAIMDGKPGA